MDNQTSFRYIAAISAILAAVTSITSVVVLFMAVDFNFDLLSTPGDLITAGLDAEAASLFRWGSVLELLSYNVFLIPVILYLWYWLKPRNPSLVTLGTILALISIPLGVIETTMRATIWPQMMVAYPQAAEAQRQVLEVMFVSFTDFNFEGLYAVNSILSSLWWLGLGLALRAERRILGIATFVMGIAIFGAGSGWLLQVDPLARLEMVYFFLPFWLIWIGIFIWRRGEKSEFSLEPAAAG